MGKDIGVLKFNLYRYLFVLLFFIIFPVGLFSSPVLNNNLSANNLDANKNDDCVEIEQAFIIGDYKRCESINENLREASFSLRCRYLKSLCMIANESYDKARYELSIISSDIPKNSLIPGEINALSLISLAEIAFLSGEYKKARTLSTAVNDLLIKKLPGSYPYSVSQVLTVKSYFDARELSTASKKLALIRGEKTDKVLYSALDPWL
jgi:hypothetical protein